MSTESDPLSRERAFYVANAFGTILYGVQLYMYFHTLTLIVKGKAFHGRRGLFYIAYTSLLLTMRTVGMVPNAILGQRMWIEHRDYPGGPLAYFDTHLSALYQVVGSAASIVSNFFGDGLLVYRAFLIWDQSAPVLFSTGTLFVAETVFAVMAIVESSFPRSTLFGGQAVLALRVWLGLTTGLNIIVTALISTKLIIVRRTTPMSADLSRVYTGIIAILVESALPFSIAGICFLVATTQDSPVELPFAIIWGALTSITPQMIILRIALGQGWTRRTLIDLRTRTLQFAEDEQTSFHARISSDKDTEIVSATLNNNSSRGSDCHVTESKERQV